jgi:dolichyl-phosphate-mannose-protein mannosyltransferase
MTPTTARWLAPQMRLDALIRTFRRHGPLALVMAVLFGVGLWLRAHTLGEPIELKWDEIHYVGTARSYLAHQYAWNDHPPLGKLILAGAMALGGDDPTVWRSVLLGFGMANVALTAWFARAVFTRSMTAWMAAAFVAGDGFFIAYSRAALLDGMIVAFGLTALCLMLRARGIASVVAAGFFAGAAASCKLNGLAFVVTAMGLCLASRKRLVWTPVLLLSAVTTFYAQCAAALVLTGRSGSVAAVIEENKAMIRHHLSYTVVHPMSSHWYTWFLPLRPIVLRRDVDIDGSIRTLMGFGNPLLWWASSVAVIVTAIALVRHGPTRVVKEIFAVGTPVPADSDAALFWTLVAWAAPVVFWIPSLRDAYLYHYLPSFVFALVLLAGLAERAYAKHRLAVVASLACVLCVTAYYAPIAAELPIAQGALNGRLFFPFWR